MKGKLLTTIFSLAILVGLTANAFSQVVSVKFDAPLIDPITGIESSTGTAYLIIEASQDTITNGIQAPNIANPYFLSNGDMFPDDVHDPNNPDWMNYPISALTTYYSSQTDPFAWSNGNQSQAIALDTTTYLTGNTYSFFVRVFNNLTGNPLLPGFGPDSSFDANGNYIADHSLLQDTYYFDTGIQTVTIPPAPDTGVAYFTIGAGDQNWIPLIDSDPIPEPSAMLLMAMGLLWFGRKLKRN